VQTNVKVDRDAAKRLGVSSGAIDAALYNAFGQRQVATIYTSSTQYKVVLEVAPEFQTDPAALSRIYVTGSGGAQVPLSTVAKFSNRIAPLTINHQGQFPAVTLSFNLAPGTALGQAVERIQQTQRDLQAPVTLDGTFQGTAQAFQSSLSSTPLLIAAAILAVYIVLGMLYESFAHPLTILSSLPSAACGALLALWLTTTPFTLMTTIACILVVGMAMRNSVMMVDFALAAERNDHLPAHEAILLAAKLRVRPIVMTTLAAGFSALPLALGTGPGHEIRQPVGIALIGGLLVSQVLTLYTTPVVYLVFDRLRRSRTRRRSYAALANPAE
jgi:multidrug efflux pump subunit AcrB